MADLNRNLRVNLDVADIKSCPFCGGEGVLDSKPHGGEGEHAHFVRCISCGCEGPWMKNPHGAVRFWNMRTPEPAMVEPRNAMARRVDEIAKDLGAERRASNPAPAPAPAPDWLYQISYGLADSRKVRVLIDGKRFAVVQSPGSTWGDNSGTHYGSTTYYLVDKECTTYSKSVGLLDSQRLQDGGRAKLAQWKKLVAERDSNGE